MPYKDKRKDRMWHRNHMGLKRKLSKSVSKSGIVTPSTLRGHPVDDNVFYDV